MSTVTLRSGYVGVPCFPDTGNAELGKSWHLPAGEYEAVGSTVHNVTVTHTKGMAVRTVTIPKFSPKAPGGYFFEEFKPVVR